MDHDRVDVAGRRAVINAARPLGRTVPETLTPAEFAAVAVTGRESVSDLLIGTALGRPVVSVRVP